MRHIILILGKIRTKSSILFVEGGEKLAIIAKKKYQVVISIYETNYTSVTSSKNELHFECIGVSAPMKDIWREEHDSTLAMIVLWSYVL